MQLPRVLRRVSRLEGDGLRQTVNQSQSECVLAIVEVRVPTKPDVGCARYCPRMSRAWLALLSVVIAAGALAAGCGASSATPSTSSTAAHEVAKASRDLPTGVLPRSTILAHYRTTRPGVTTEAKLVSLADLEAASDGELTQCQFRGCPPGAWVWLILQNGPPGAFSASTDGLPGVRPSGGAAAWSLFPVDASTGQGRGDSELGPLAQLRSSPWGQLRDMDASR